MATLGADERSDALAIPRLITYLQRAADEINASRALNPEFAVAVAVWLRDEATKAAASFRAITAPSTEVDQPPGVAYGDPARARRILEANHRHALDVADAFLGRPIQ